MKNGKCSILKMIRDKVENGEVLPLLMELEVDNLKRMLLILLTEPFHAQGKASDLIFDSNKAKF